MLVIKSFKILFNDCIWFVEDNCIFYPLFWGSQAASRGENGTWETRGALPPGGGPDMSPVDSEGVYARELSPPPSEKGSILVARAFAPVLWLWTWHFTLSWLPKTNLHAGEITQHRTSQPRHDWHCGLDHSLWRGRPVLHKMFTSIPGPPPPPTTTKNLSQYCQISPNTAKSPRAENHWPSVKRLNNNVKLYSEGIS